MGRHDTRLHGGNGDKSGADALFLEPRLFSVAFRAYGAASPAEQLVGLEVRYAEAVAEAASLSAGAAGAGEAPALALVLRGPAPMRVYNACFGALLRLRRLLWLLHGLGGLGRRAEEALGATAAGAAAAAGEEGRRRRGRGQARREPAAAAPAGPRLAGAGEDVEAAAAAAARALLAHLRRVQAQRRTALHFASTVHAHVAHGALHAPWQRLMAEARRDASVPALRMAHAVYLRAVGRACFVDFEGGGGGGGGGGGDGAGAGAGAGAASAALARLLARVDAFAGLCADFFRAAASGELAAASRLLAALDSAARGFPRQVALAALAARQAAALGGEAELRFKSLVDGLSLNNFYE